ncbi:MAG TPA: tetratricopeptide repeat protein, partial [Terriglobales bacterium]
LLHIEYGRTLSYERSFQQALDQYQQVLKSEPDNIAALLGIAKVRSWQGYQEQALVEYDKVLQRDPGNYDAIVGQAFSLIWTGKKNEAIPLLERANSRHPEDAEVRDALKRLGGVNVFTGDISAGDPPLPILPPAIKKVPGKSVSAKAETSPSAATTAEKNPENNPPQPTPGEQPPAPGSTSGADRHTVLWLVGMGVTMMVAVFAVAGFLLFVLPAARKKRESQSMAITNPLTISKPIEPWARLEELSRGQEEAPKSKRPTSTPVSSTPVRETAKISDPASDPWYYVPERPKPLPEPYETTPANGDESSRLPRRRRGVAERPWWRETPLPENSTDAAPKSEKPVPEPPAFAAPAPASTAPLIDAHDSDTVVIPSGFANPLTPAAEKPAPPEEEPASPRPFTLVLSKALERAGDGHFEESNSADPLPKEEASFDEGSNGHKTPSAAEPEPEVAPIDAETRAALQGLTAVIVGCGVMVTHYRAVLRAAGIDVRTFTFWDLAMTSMRKRRADILLIDGDTLDGFTVAQMYTSAQIERYMFGTALVGIGSGDDRTKLPDDVLLPHSLSDQDFRERLLEALRTR